MKYFRWAAVLPAAIVALFISSILVYAIIKLSTFMYNDIPILDKILHDVLKNGIASYYFVVIGSMVAPSHKVTTALILTVIFSTICGASLFIANFITKDYYSNLAVISGIAGAIIGYIYISKSTEEVTD